MIIRARNNLADAAISTYLSMGEAAAQTVLRVKNTSGFQASWAIQLGNTGEEQAEIRVLSAGSPSGTAGTVTAATSFAHPADTPMFLIKFDQLIFKRSTSGTAGTATALSSGTVSIQPDSLFTQFDDTSGASTYAYKVAFRNSVTADTSSDSDWLTPSGYSFYSLSKMRDRVRGRMFNSSFINDDQINDWINEWKERMENAAIDVNKDYSLGTTAVAFAGTAELGTITATDFKDIRRVWLTTNGTDYYDATKMMVNEYAPNQVFTETHPYFYMQGDNVIGRRPSTQAGTANLVYYKTTTPLVNDTDELPVSQHNYTKSFVDYCHAQALYVDGKTNNAQSKERLALSELDKFKNEIGARLRTGVTSIRVVEPLSGDDGIW